MRTAVEFGRLGRTARGVQSRGLARIAVYCVACMQVTDTAVKDRVVKKVQDTVLSKWQNEPNRIDKRSLSLIYMAHASDVLENAFAPLSDDDYELAMKRVRELLDVDPDMECTKPNSNDIVWAVVAAFLK
mmetsp:Transcript_15214/g.45238  ORF Transcript_15214/g.45238 Transcript_15214/m.45238 type:complete len:130 (-) Transcript_15214:197-586(-)